jgi:dolichol-phosphate mannosyltransferase
MSVVVPVYNEIACLPMLHERLVQVRSRLDNCEIRVIYVDDGSTDGSAALVQSLSEHDWVDAIRLTRNFGHQLAVTAGLDAAQGEYVAVIDSDLQDPPELLPAMLAQLRASGAHVVFGRRRQRPGETRFKKSSARLFYRMIRALSGVDIPMDTGDFRVMDRVATDALCGMREHNRFLRGMVPWTGLRAEAFDYDRDVRFAGATKFSLRRMLLFGANAVFAFSALPIRLIQALGVLLVGLGVLGAAGSLIATIAGASPSVLWLLVWVNLILAGLVLAAVGIVGGYVHRIQDEVRGRPLYVVEPPSPARPAVEDADERRLATTPDHPPLVKAAISDGAS